MKSYSSKEVIKLLQKDGWSLVDITGDHYQFKHYVKKGKVTVPHPKKDLTKRIIKYILKQAGLNPEL